ncbi:MAG: hypothetical protein QXJ68_00070 [Methanocellales archaeon]
MFLFSEEGVTEPYSDLLAISLVLTGYLIFIILISSAYSSHASKAYAMEHYSELNFLAQKLKGKLACSDREDLLDAEKLTNFKVSELLDREFELQITIIAEDRIWNIGEEPSFFTTRSSILIPATVRINPAQSVEGTLKLTIWRRP